MRVTAGMTIVGLVGGTAFAVAQTTHLGHGTDLDHAAHGVDRPSASAVLTEPGQGAFAALSEVVRVLEAGPDTDWSSVDLAGLRAHLIDMDRLMTHAVVTEMEVPDGLVAAATGDAATLDTLGRMVPAHAAQLAVDERWMVKATRTDDGVELRVTSDDPAVVARIRGLGFFGLMASQDHHREHHLMIASGENAHGH